MLPRIGLTVMALALVAAAACRENRRPPSVGDPEIVDHSEAHVLPTAANGRDYRITVGLPDSYAAQPQQRYPVLYVTDGYWDYKLLKSIIGGLVYDKVIPEVILVGIGYPIHLGDAPNYGRLRRWDLTPVPGHPADDANLGESGHAGEFLDVIERQIIPYVEGRYRADPSYRVLGGSSLGGLFALYAMLTKPALFAAYIAPSPAAPHARGWLFGYEEAFAKSGKLLAARLYMTAAEKEEPALVDAIKRFDAQLRGHAYPSLAYEFKVIEGERHAGTKPESFNRGVRFAFAPRAPERADTRAAEDVSTLLRGIDLDMRQGRSPVPRMDRLRAIGPAACAGLLPSFGKADEDPQKKRIVHQLLVDLRGQDLGPDAGPWSKWCQDVSR